MCLSSRIGRMLDRIKDCRIKGNNRFSHSHFQYIAESENVNKREVVVLLTGLVERVAALIPIEKARAL
ncbi:MAG: hypothetical protein P8013_12300 [Candidatus Sulfobium sp.]